MQRLTMLRPRIVKPSQPSLSMVKEAGTPVDFTKAREVGLGAYTFREDIFGIYAYQGEPVTVSGATRDAFVNGALGDLQNQAAGQGMEIKYILITWNEVKDGEGNYYITDLVVGVVARVTRDYNTGPAYLVDSLKAVWWFNQMVAGMVMPWKSWLLLNATQDKYYHNWYWEAVSKPWKEEVPLHEPIPGPPSVDEAKIAITGEANAALGTFTTKLIDNGYTPTIFGRRVQVCYQMSPEYVTRWATHGRVYRTHVRFSWDFVTDPEFTVEDGRLLPGFITAAFIIKLILVVGGLVITGVSVYTFLNNVTTERSGYVIWDVLRDAEGNPVYDEEGNPIMVPKEQGWSEGPPEWWGGVLKTLVIIAGVGIVAVIVIPPIIGAFRGK
jgi:hypothetical protein